MDGSIISSQHQISLMGFRFHLRLSSSSSSLSRLSSRSHLRSPPLPLSSSSSLTPIFYVDNISRLGLTTDIGLSLGKALTGYLCGSTAIIADAAHSVSDVVLSGVALVSYRAANVPKDKEHPYGHGKFETLGALAISGMLLATGCGISWHALDLLVSALPTSPELVLGNHSHGGHHHGIDMSHPALALTVTIASITALLDHKTSWRKIREWIDDGKCMASSIRCNFFCSCISWSWRVYLWS